MSEQPGTQVPETVTASAEKVRDVMDRGGVAELTVRSRKSGRHVNVKLVAKKKEDGRYVSRQRREGRVGIPEAVCVFAEDPSLDWPENRVGSLWLPTGSWKSADGADAARVWAAERVLSWIRGGFPLEKYADVFLATRCCVCAAKLTHPESVDELIGPECSGRRRKGRQATRPRAEAPAPVPAGPRTADRVSAELDGVLASYNEVSNQARLKPEYGGPESGYERRQLEHEASVLAGEARDLEGEMARLSRLEEKAALQRREADEERARMDAKFGGATVLARLGGEASGDRPRRAPEDQRRARWHFLMGTLEGDHAPPRGSARRAEMERELAALEGSA